MRDGGPRAAHVVGVHVRHRLQIGTPPAEHGRQPQVLQQVRQRIVLVHRDDEHAVHPRRPQILCEPLPLLRRADQRQQQLHVGLGEFRSDPPHDVREVRLGEELGLRLRDDQGDRVGPVPREGPCRPVRYVAELGHGLFDRGLGLVADPQRAVDHPGHRPPADPARAATSSSVGCRLRRPFTAIRPPHRRPRPGRPDGFRGEPGRAGSGRLRPLVRTGARPDPAPFLGALPCYPSR